MRVVITSSTTATTSWAKLCPPTLTHLAFNLLPLSSPVVKITTALPAAMAAMAAVPSSCALPATAATDGGGSNFVAAAGDGLGLGDWTAIM